MKTNQLLYAIIGGGIVAAAWVASHFAASIPVGTVIGYGAVAAIVALATVDYRIRVKRLFR
ncbi:MAG TPA: hypothetical protein VHF69_08170 [Candidatus Synoicihabitans sp.]|nr:hypothetical protein [Candidatus Synoicihabitans sp.]